MTAHFHQPITRRDWLTLGGLAGLGLALPDLLRARSVSPESGTFGRARSVIVLYLHGGHAQQETWDPKPDGPSPERGEFGAIPTSVPGVQVSELLPRSARLMHKLAVIRSLSHDNSNHVQASLPAMTGHAHPPRLRSRGDFPPSATDFPPFGAVLDHLRPARRLPTWVQVGPLMRRNNGTVLHGQVPGFLGNRHAPLVIDQDLLGERVRVDSVTPPFDLSPVRLSARRHLLRQLDAQGRQLHTQAEAGALDSYQQRALDLITSPAVARAFDLGAEPRPVRDGYGRTQFGQGCLLARRLVEAGVPMVNVHFCRTPPDSWDTHGKHFKKMKDSLCPIFDAAFSALVSDLDGRGLLGRTLVLATAEFGRTPKINKNAGRDHWPWVYSVALAGGGAGQGVVYGSSDKAAAHPREHPHDPKDLAATVYHLLGIPADTTLRDASDRPHALVIGKKINGLLG
jgi:uncharacterized protein (DUF1501 family)